MKISETIKVLHDLQKYRRDKHVPAKYPMPDPKLIGEAIDTAMHYLRCLKKGFMPLFSPSGHRLLNFLYELSKQTKKQHEQEQKQTTTKGIHD